MSEDDPVAALRAAAEDLADVREAISSRGAADVERVAAAHRTVTDLLDRYEERATDWDDAEGYFEFRDALADAVSDLPADLPERAAFEAVEADLRTGSLTQTLSAADFDAARETLDPAAEYARLERRRETALAAYREARSDAVRRRDELRERLDALDGVLRFADADLDADATPLRAPIEAYNGAVREAFGTRQRAVPARQFLEEVARAAAFPLTGLARPPADLREYLADADVGTEPLSTVRSYAEYSPSKLDHYVADAEAFRRHVGANRGYLSGLDADPLTVSWPPPPADRLRRRARELERGVRRFDGPVEPCRRLRALSRTDDYPRRRMAAVARDELDETDRRRLRDGSVREEREQVAAALSRVRAALDEHPPV
ncbi:MAG: hypothetical protein ABEJ70_06485 [Halobacteriaceae archaeon]